MSSMILGAMKSTVGKVKKKLKKADEYAQDEAWKRSYARLILPSRMETYDTHLRFDQRTYVRCLVCGLRSSTGAEGYPRELSSKVIERLQELSFEGVKIMLSTSLIQIPGTDTKESLQQASYNVNKAQRLREITHKGNPDLELMMQYKDIVDNYRQIYFNSQRTFHSSFIIVIKGGESEVFRAESEIIAILKSELIEVCIPTGKMLEMFLSALPLPVSESKSWVEVRTDGAAALCAASNLNSRTDDKGLYFGKDLLTNNEILLDLDTLASKQLVMCGSTGSGKTFTFLLLLTRLMDMRNARVIYTTPKADEGTNYRAVAEFYQDRGCIADIGMNGSEYLNPLDILIDPETMGSSPYAYAKAYDLKKDTLIYAHKVWLGNGFTANMDSYLDETLDKVYEQAHIYRDDPESFKNKMPVYKDLRAIWALDAADDRLGTKQKTAEALLNKTYQFSETGRFSRYNNQTKGLDLSKDLIVVDMSEVPKTIKSFMSIIVNGMLATRFSTDVERETYLAVDEGAVYLRNDELCGNLLDTLTQGRSHKFYLWIATHQPADFKKNKVSEEFKTNTFINILLGNNIKNAIDDVKDYFHLSDEECDILCNCDVGEGLLLFKDERIPIRFEPTRLEKDIIKGVVREGEKAAPEAGFLVKKAYKNLVRDHKIIFEDWITGDSSILLQRGYEKHQVTRVDKAGTVTAYAPQGMIENKIVNLPGLGDQTLDHYASVLQLAALLIKYGFEEIQINHTGEQDIISKINGQTIAWEYERYNKKNLDIIVKKKAAALEKCDKVWFVCSSADVKYISKAVGEDYTLARGAAVTEILEAYKKVENLRKEKQENCKIEPALATSELTEAL